MMIPRMYVAVTPVVAIVILLMTGASPVMGDSPAELGPPPGSYEKLTGDEVIRIPFELYRDDIRMIAEINGRDVRMLIDNGSLWDQLLFFGSPRVDELGFDYDGQIQIGGVGGGDGVMADMATGVTVRFPGIEFTDQTAIVTPYTKGERNPWEGADGQVSAVFFKNFVVEIDFDEMVLQLTEPDKFTYAGGGREIEMIPVGFDSRNVPCLLEMGDGSTIPLELMLDLGGVHPLSLVVGLGSGIRIPEGSVETSVGYGIQGEVRGHMGRVRSFSLAGYSLTDVTAAFTAPEASGGFGETGIIGMPLLSRFNVVLDYPHGKMYIEPNSHFREPFELRLPRGGSDPEN